MLKCHVSLVARMARQNGPSAIRDKLVKKGLPLKLAQSLVRCQQSMGREFSNFFDNGN